MSDSTSTTISKLPTGIEGLDRLLRGGLPDRRMTLVTGGAGAGKSVLSMQILLSAARDGKPGVVVGFEETPQEMLENLTSFEWDLLPNLERDVHLMEAAVGDDFFAAGDFDIAGLLAGVESKVTATGARWVLFDGLDALLRALGNPQTALRELLRLRRWIAKQEVATLVTAKTDEDSGGHYARDFGFLPFVADCVIRLMHTMSENVFVRTMRVIKYRGGPSAGAEVPFVIDGHGIGVAYNEGRRLEHEVSEARVSSGIPRLDNLIGGGYLCGSSILVSGAPGTAKTTLAVALAQAACRRGEKALFASFDESAVQITRNMRSIGFELDPYQRSGLLHMEGFRASGISAEDHLLEIEALLQAHKPDFLLVDPISAIKKAGGDRLAADVTERLLDRAKSRGITVLMTSLLENAAPEQEGTNSHISTIADTWIALSYNVRAGERNRALTIVKARGTEHSNQVRELTLSADGLTLSDIYTASGEVLMGTARIEREAQEQRERFQRKAENARAQEIAEREIAEGEERIRALSRELEARRQYLESLREERAVNERSRQDELARVRRSRHADRDEPSTR